MKVYLVEVMIGETLEPISIQSNFEKALYLLAGKTGIISELNLDEVYPEGIGVCQHWHFPEEDEGEQK